jgi:hypothetical protein
LEIAKKWINAQKRVAIKKGKAGISWSGKK